MGEIPYAGEIYTQVGDCGELYFFTFRYLDRVAYLFLSG